MLKRSGTADKPAAEDKPNRTVLDIQRALNKAGYGPLTEDGQMGPSTKTALTKFETDRKLPPRGEPKGGAAGAGFGERHLDQPVRITPVPCA